MQKEAPTYPILPITAEKFKSAQTYEYPSYHRVFVFEHQHVRNPPTCRQMSCRLDTLADMQCPRVGIMTKDMSPTCRDTTRHVCKWRLRTTRHKKTFPAKPAWYVLSGTWERMLLLPHPDSAIWDLSIEVVCQSHYICMKWIWYEFIVVVRTLSLHNSTIHDKNLHTHLQTWQLYCDDSGVRTQSYNCPPHIKYTKHLLYVWSGSSMSMKWMRGLVRTE
jgi:hypothetical protein